MARDIKKECSNTLRRILKKIKIKINMINYINKLY